MNKQFINNQCLQDTHLFRLRRSSEDISWRQITDQMNSKFGTVYSLNDLISRYELISQTFTKEQLTAAFEEFQFYDLDFITIAQHINSTVYQVKREIVTVIINNIWKVCFLVRKRKISGLKSNFINNRGIKQLVVQVMKPDAFAIVKEEYGLLWKFISKYYNDSHFQTVSDEQYKCIYRQLIILAQKFKISPDIDEGEFLSFQKYILSKETSANNMEVQSAFEQLINLDQSKKKQEQQMINLLSDDECQNRQINHFQETQQQQQELQVEPLRILQQMVIIKYTMQLLRQNQESESTVHQLAKQALKLTVLSQI